MFHLKFELLVRNNSNNTQSKALCTNTSKKDAFERAAYFSMMVYYILKIVKDIFLG